MERPHASTELIENDGVRERALFVIDNEGMISSSYGSPVAVCPEWKGYYQLSKRCQYRRTMSELTIPVTKQDHIQGDLNAPCRLVEYGDYECPSCGSVEPIVKKLQARFGERLSFVFRNFPIRKTHPWAGPAALAAECAGSHGKFWEMHDLLFASQERLNETTIRRLYQKLGLADSDMGSSRANVTAQSRIDADFAGGTRSGVNETPTFFLNDERYDGPTDYESLAALMEQVLISDGE